jgi:hypothetical protein
MLCCLVVELVRLLVLVLVLQLAPLCILPIVLLLVIDMVVASCSRLIRVLLALSVSVMAVVRWMLAMHRLLPIDW